MTQNDAVARLAANTGWLLADRVARALLGFLVGAWVARYLGPQQFGRLNYIFALVAFFQMAAGFGTENLVVRDIASNPASAPAILGSVLRLRIVSGVVLWLLSLLTVLLIEPDAIDTVALVAIAGGAMVFQSFDIIDLWFQSQSKSKLTVISKLCAYLVTSLFKVVLVIMQASLVWFVIAFLIDFILAAIALGYAYRVLPTENRWTFDGRILRSLLAQSWPFMLSGMSAIIYMRIDQIMLKALRGEYEVGIFAAALPLSQIWQMLPTAFAISLGPYIARQKLKSETAYESALRIVFRMFLILGLSTSLFTWILAPVALPAIYGAQFAGAAAVLRIHVFTNIFVAMGVAQGLWIANERIGKLMLLQTACGAAVAVVGNLYAIPIWGAMGAASVAVAAQATSGILINMIFRPRLFAMQLGIRRRRDSA